ncbi:MAG: FAD-dependent oxidoreductase [Coriobacteriales bacterium]
MQKFDVVVIGGGVCGCMIARELARYQLDVAVLERANDVGKGSSKANSGLIHTGFHARGGSLKGLSTVEGNALYTQLAAELEVPFRRIGGLYCAFGPAGMERLREKHGRALANGAGDLPIISGDEARELEPRLSEGVIAAMVAESTGIISPFALVIACAENAAANGARFLLNAQVERIEHLRGCWNLHLADGRRIDARYVVNAAGDMAAVLDAQVHPADLVVLPKRGQFYVFDKQGALDAPEPIRHVLFQAAENDEGGTLLAPTVDGNILAGPTSEDVEGFGDRATTAAGLAHVEAVARKIVPDIRLGRVITSFAGVRANIDNVVKEKKDFVVRASAPGFVSLLGIKNPGMTSAPALARRAVELLRREGLMLLEDPAFDPHRRARKPFLQCGPSEQRRLLAKDPSFGHVLCRCEKITEGDVRRELSGALPPVDVEGLKHRLRVTMGRCQGGFCKPRVQAVIDEMAGRKPADALPAHVADEAREASELIAHTRPARLRWADPRFAPAPGACPPEFDYDVVVIGGGAGGLAAATAAARAGARTLLLEREEYLGGVLPQCIHDGFGLYVYRQNMTGPQYAKRWIAELEASGAEWACATSVTGLEHDDTTGSFALHACGAAIGGPRALRARSVVVAGGCREVTRGQLRIPGDRPEGIYTAGTAQYMLNIEHRLPGREAVILGGGDIGLIMARRMTLSGAHVRMLVAKEATGLVRNHRRCIDPYRIETRYGWGVASIRGARRLEGVWVAPFGEDGALDGSRAEFVPCDTLLISCGLVPERELFEGVEGSPGLFVTGNAESVHDLVDRVSVEALACGQNAAAYAGCLRELPEHLAAIAALNVPLLPVGERVG